MRLPKMSGNAWVCTIIGIILVASGVEQVIHAVNAKDEPPPPPTPRVQAPLPGDPAPAFELPDPSGKKISLAQFRGKPTIVSFYCGCGSCEEIAKRLAPWQKKKHAQMIGLVTFLPEYFDDFRKKTGANHILVQDPGKTVAAKYDSMICPRLWVLDAKGRVVATNPTEPTMLGPDETVEIITRSFGQPAPEKLNPNGPPADPALPVPPKPTPAAAKATS